jgi:hypothetical protein
MQNRKSNAVQPHTPHLAGPGGHAAPGVPPTGLAAAPGQPGMGMGPAQYTHHHEQPGGPPGRADEVSGMFHSQM